MNKINVGVIFGGRSAEHEISLLSAKNVINALDPNKYEITLIGIDKDGTWFINNDKTNYLLNSQNPKLIKHNKTDENLALLPTVTETEKILNLKTNQKLGKIDVVFPVLHGTYGEDGTIQGLFKMMDLPFVGPDVMGSSVCMDKDTTKRLLRDSGIPIAEFFSINKKEFYQGKVDFKQMGETINYPLFIKPSRAGSSVGVYKVKDSSELEESLKKAFRFDTKILMEKTIVGREIELAVLGNEELKVSIPGEVIPQNDFYSYEAKYIDENGAKLSAPAENISPQTIKELQDLAKKAFKTVGGEGMARVDFFLETNGNIILNEINTIPGFTKISMFPKLMELSGIPYSQLIDQLIELAIERHKRDSELLTNMDL